MIKSFFKKFATRKQAGDTIVEVLISVCVLSAVLASCYVIANHSLQTGTESAQRSEALSLAQKQIEYIKYAVNNPTSSPGLLNAYKNPTNPNSPFCIIGTSPSSAIQSTPCQQGSGSQYKISTKYSGLIFTVTAVWDSVNGSGQDQMTLYYKLPGNFVSPAIDDSSLYAEPISNSGATLHGSINPNNNTVSYYFQYGIADFSKKTPTALLAQSDNNFHAVSAIIPAGSLTAGTAYQFRLCIDGSGCSGTAHFSTKGPPTITSLSATPSSVLINSSVTVTWSVMNANSCSASSLPASSWSGGKSTVAGSSTVALTLPTTYRFSLTCIGTDGISTTSRTSNAVSVSLPPPPTVDVWASAYSIQLNLYGTTSVTIYWNVTNVSSCTKSWGGTTGSSGSDNITLSSPGTYVYTMICNDGYGRSARDSTTVNVTVPTCQYGGAYPNCNPAPRPKECWQHVYMHPDVKVHDGACTAAEIAAGYYTKTL